MPKQKPIEVITPPNVLKTKIGGALPALDQKAIARAEAALQKLSDQFGDWINEELAKLLEAWANYEAAPERRRPRTNSTAAPTTSRALRRPMAIRWSAASAPRCAS